MTAVATAPARPYGRRGARPATARSGAGRLRCLPLPDTEPPVERGDLEGTGGPCLGQGTLALLSSGLDDEDELLFGPQPTPTRELPDPARWGRQVTQLVVEVLAGHRPVAQLVRWTGDDVYRQVLQRIRPLTPGPDRTRVGRSRGTGRDVVDRPVIGGVRVSEPQDGVAEVAAVVHRRQRVQAVALRLEGRDGRWVVTVLQLG